MGARSGHDFQATLSPDGRVLCGNCIKQPTGLSWQLKGSLK